jgi:hypothetical protein
MRIFGERMCEVYTQVDDLGNDTLRFVGYVAEKPGREYYDAHVSTASGSFKGVEWSDTLKGWVIKLAPWAPAPCPEEVNGCKTTCCCGDYMEDHADPMSCGHSPVSMHDYYCCQSVADEQRTDAGTFSGTLGVEW